MVLIAFAGCAAGPAVTTRACVNSVAMCQGTVVSGVTPARLCGLSAGMTSSTTDQLEAEGAGRLTATTWDFILNSGGWQNDVDVAWCRITADDAQRHGCIPAV